MVADVRCHLRGFALALTTVLLFAGGTSHAQETAIVFSHPCMYLNAQEIEEIRDRIRNDATCRDMFTAMCADADALLAREPHPVTGPFTRALERPVTEQSDAGPPTDAALAHADFTVARNLGLVYALTTDERYAEKVVAFATAWQSAMTTEWPQTLSAWQALAETLPALLYAVDLCWNSTAATAEFKTGLQAWVKELITKAKQQHPFASPETTAWNLNAIGAGGVICEDPEWIRFLYDDHAGNIDTFQGLLRGSKDPKTNEALPGLLDGDGRAHYEVNEPDEYRKAMRLFKALAYVAELARHYGQDLYAFTYKGRSLKAGLLHYVGYYDGSERDANIGVPFRGVIDGSIYELAYARYHAPEFERVLQARGRKVVDPDILGPISLTHGAMPMTAGSAIGGGAGRR